MSERDARARPGDNGKAEPVRRWAPQHFRLEPTTLWSFPERGSWAGHEGSYRGNWSPYIPRNLILRYTQPGELVLDPFVGGGTTAVEAKLLGRRCLALDRNLAAIARSRERLRFEPPASAATAVHAPGLL
ncbi:MAG TPA: DNA methyltransferase, partial [Chloroflexota bacterium]